MNMNSNDETIFTISTQETPLLQIDGSNQPRIKNLRTKIFFLVRILLVFITGLFILHSRNQEKPEPVTPYFSGLARYYCHLTPHPTLCHDSISSLGVNPTALDSDPTLIFALPLQLVASELSRASISITGALSLPASKASACQSSIRYSLSLIGRWQELLSVDLLFDSEVPDGEELTMMDDMAEVERNSRGCLVALGDGAGVEEVKMGVEKASMLLDNFVAMFEGRDIVIDDFYNRYNPLYYTSLIYGYGFDYVFIVCLFSVMYLFLALLFFLFWQ